MEDHRASLLAELLSEFAREGTGYIPEVAFRPFHSAVSFWATEIVLINRVVGQNKIFLKKYDGGIKEFSGLWHLPGGYNRAPEQDIQTTISRVAQREIGVDVRMESILDALKWENNDHPYGHPLSLFVLCKASGQLVVDETQAYFPINKLPNEMVKVQKNWIENFFVNKNPRF